MRALIPTRSVVVALLAVAMSACSSATNRPATPPVSPAASPGGAASAALSNRAFRYTAGTHHYVVRSDATIELATDTATHRVPVTTTTTYTVTLSPAASGGFAVRGVADSFSVTRGAEIPVAQGDSGHVPSPVPFNATITATGEILSFQGPPASGCDSAVDLRAASGRELFIPVPAVLRDSTEWRDSTSTTSCRGGVPVTTDALHSYRVVGPASWNGVPAIELLRTSTIRIAGSGTPPNRTNGTFALTGNGTATAMLYLEPGSGTFLGGTSEGHADITITTARGQLPFHQEVRQQITLQR